MRRFGLSRWTKSGFVRFVYLVLAMVATVACEQESSREDAKDVEAVEPPLTMFADWTQKSGLSFRHYSGASGLWHMPEIIGSGVALLDYDADGDLDVFFVQSSDYFRQSTDQSSPAGAEEFPLPPGQARGHRLFANQLIPSGQLSFRDVTEAAGLADESYGMGVAVADYDNDGDVDLYVTSFGANALYRNTQGVFEKLDNAAGAQDELWSTSASFCDVNNDRLPDLYVSNYVYYQRSDQVDCRDSLGQQDYCGPQAYVGAPDALFINQGNGRFAKSSRQWGVATAASAGLGVVCRDLNQDGTVDVYVANDAMPNLLLLNRDHKVFEEQGQLMGAAINVNGLAEGSMGIAAGDFDDDGDDDLFLTHLANETNTLYRNDGKLGFLDFTSRTNLASPSLSYTGFGTQWLDIDNDSDLDLYVANGAVQRAVDGTGRVSRNYDQKNQVFINNGGRFTNAEARGGDATSGMLTGRGAAFGDIDNDGDTDIVVSSKDGEARLFVNRVGHENSWLGVELQGTDLRDVSGAILRLTLASGVTLRRVVHTDGSYLSASDPRVLFGLGDLVGDQSVSVSWPSGRAETFSSLEPGRYHLLVEGAGTTGTGTKP